MKDSRPMLVAEAPVCPSCGSADVEIKEVGKFVWTWLLICRAEGNREHNFRPPRVVELPPPPPPPKKSRKK